ncbi:class I SAM-dependent methyltransferase [Kitasatospora sp. A2-31]|uniref:methyltransferase domain-containing protein n=1 Tax=Kitasatospora sp. A2-31 TaxID=2916414 RepID=UPI001EE9F1DD|nr:class I SAM-dependent methyltransferase [Kitasatospora sp. A2-31]MCG6494555.1 class I SAM-dependent methyltransferase [Kitasatospora sp. A2-31]
MSAAHQSLFREIYQVPGLYDQLLLPHYFDGAEDTQLIRQLMERHYGRPGDAPGLSVAELGCGTGRVTACLAPYARHLRASDYSRSMVDTFQARYPKAEALQQETRFSVRRMLDEGLAGSFDIVGAFWSLSYPLMDYFEELGADGIVPRSDLAQGRREAGGLVRDTLRLLAPGGHLLALFFDSETPEQQLVTRAWEKVAPFPGTGRGYTREILLEELQDAEARGEGRLHYSRLGGIAVAPSPQAARAWFATVHMKSLPVLMDDPHVHREIGAFVDAHTQPSGEVRIPTGAYVIDFWAGPADRHVPRNRAEAA